MKGCSKILHMETIPLHGAKVENHIMRRSAAPVTFVSLPVTIGVTPVTNRKRESLCIVVLFAARTVNLPDTGQ